MQATNEQKAVEFRFIKTVQQGESWVAMMADETALSAAGTSVDALRSASRTGAFNTLRIRGGVHYMNSDQLQTELGKAKDCHMTAAAENLERAFVVVNQKNGTPVKLEAPELKETAPAFRK